MRVPSLLFSGHFTRSTQPADTEQPSGAASFRHPGHRRGHPAFRVWGMMLVSLLVLLATAPALADQTPGAPSSTATTPPPDTGVALESNLSAPTATTDNAVQSPAEKVHGPGLMSSFEYSLSMAVLLFGLLIIALEVYLIRVRDVSADYMIKFLTLTLIITGALFLITAGYDNDQIAPAFGLLGTIAGYLLGRSTGPEKAPEPTPKPADPAK